MNDSQKGTSKAIALFLSLGLISSLAGCGIGGEGEEGGEDGEGEVLEQPIEQNEGGEDGEYDEDDEYDED